MTTQEFIDAYKKSLNGYMLLRRSRMERKSEWIVSWVSEERPNEEQETRFNTWEGAMAFYRQLIDSPMFSDVHIRSERRDNNVSD